jgi:hypothetical protein
MLVGTDPELFTVRNGIIIPPICVEEEGLKRIGTLVEEDPDYHPVYYKKSGIQIIGDGAAFEFNVPPADNPVDLISYWEQAKDILRGLIPDDLEIVSKAAQRFELQTLLDNYAISEERLSYSVRFGCDTQYNVYELAPTPEVSAKDIPWRYAGGHIHISPVDHELIRPVIFGMDQTVGLLCLFNSPYPEAEVIRQEFYGVPGNYRPQKYGKVTGVEYRTPSVAWLDSLELPRQLFEVIPYVLNLVESDNMLEYYMEYNQMAREAILSYNASLGKAVLEGMHVL